MDWIDLAEDSERWRGICKCGNELLKNDSASWSEVMCVCLYICLTELFPLQDDWISTSS